MRLRIKRRMRKGLRLMRRSASGSQVICFVSANLRSSLKDSSRSYFTSPAYGRVTSVTTSDLEHR